MSGRATSFPPTVVLVLFYGDGEGGFSGADEQDLGELVEGVVLVGVAVADFADNRLPEDTAVRAHAT